MGLVCVKIKGFGKCLKRVGVILLIVVLVVWVDSIIVIKSLKILVKFKLGLVFGNNLIILWIIYCDFVFDNILFFIFFFYYYIMIFFKIKNIRIEVCNLLILFYFFSKSLC